MAPGGFDLKAWAVLWRERVDRALDAWLPKAEGPSGLVREAMRYSLMAGGKRARPLLSIGGAEAVGGEGEAVLPLACAIECIHTYSLIHDDLPAMDDDDLRRGLPTCHKRYGEAQAILAGDGLLTFAFELMTHPDLTRGISAERLIRAVHLISEAAGVRGMVGGQSVDCLVEGRPVDPETLEFIHLHKTAALITASVVSGALLAGGAEEELRALEAYGRALGLAFQIKDDLLDLEGDEAKMGKRTGSDERKGKATYPRLHGVEASRSRLAELLEETESSLKGFGPEADPLRAIARYVVTRDR